MYFMVESSEVSVWLQELGAEGLRSAIANSGRGAWAQV